MTASPGRKPLVSVVTGSFNEEENAEAFYEHLRSLIATIPRWDFEIVWIDNHSTDRTVEILRRLAQKDPNLRVIVNARNFGAVRSGYHAMMQARGDAVIVLASDFQDPPDLIPAFLAKWEEGYLVVLGQKTSSGESTTLFAIRRIYYRLVALLSNVELLENVTGFGLYDRRALEVLRGIEDPAPYLRGLVCELGFRRRTISYVQPARRRGLSKHNFFALYDMAMLGITSHSKVPLRLATFFGFAASALSLLAGIGYLVAKLVFWDRFSLGLAPVVVGLFLFASVQLFFTGMLGEYIGAIHSQVLRRPRIVEQERLNFQEDESAGDYHEPGEASRTAGQRRGGAAADA